ncbi:MAG: universal stress protein [Spirochaetota bacterium]
MFRRIIVTSDLSPESFHVVRSAAGLRSFGAESCLLLQCMSLQEAGSPALTFEMDNVDAIVERQQRILESFGFEVEARILPGFPKQELRRIVRDEHSPLTLVGTKGSTLIGEALLGGVAYALLHSMPSPLLVIPVDIGDDSNAAGESGEPPAVRKEIEEAHSGYGRHVLFPTDFSENADHACASVTELVKGGIETLTLLHVQDETRIDPHMSFRMQEFNEIDQERLEHIKESLSAHGNTSIRTEIRHGSPFIEILQSARTNRASMIVLGSQGRGFVRELFLGSVSHNIARHSDIPVMLIPYSK